MTRQTFCLILRLSSCLLILPAMAGAQTAMQLGYYVRDGSTCAEASNATISLVHKTGINGARTACTFTSMTPAGPNTFAYTESCQDLGQPDQYENSGTLRLLSPTSLWLDWDGTDGKGVTMNFCPQSAMPEPWRGNDLSSFLE